MKPETELMLVLCRTPLTERARCRARNLLETASIDWEAFFVSTRHWQIEPVVMRNAIEACGDLLSLAVKELATERGLQARALALTRALMISRLVQECEGGGVPLIVLKGCATGVTAYGDPTLRSFADIDILIKNDNVHRAKQILRDNGFVPTYDENLEPMLLAQQHALEFSGPTGKVEVHTALFSRYLRLQFNEDHVWASAQRVHSAGAEIPVLGSSVQFVFLCGHAAKHQWIGLRWICDIAQLTDRLTRTEALEIVRLATETRSKLIVALGVQIAAEILGPVNDVFPPADVRSSKIIRVRIARLRRQLGFEESRLDKNAAVWARLDPGLEPLLFWSGIRDNPVDKLLSLVMLIGGANNQPTSMFGRWVGRPMRLGARAVRRFTQLDWWSPPPA